MDWVQNNGDFASHSLRERGPAPRPRWRDTRQTTRFLLQKGGELEGCPLERVEGRQPFSRSDYARNLIAPPIVCEPPRNIDDEASHVPQHQDAPQLRAARHAR